MGFELGKETDSARVGDGSEIDCPWCGSTNGDLYELVGPEGWDGLCEEVNCEACDLPFLLTGRMEITTRAERILPKERVMTQEEWEQRLKELAEAQERARLPKRTRVMLANRRGTIVNSNPDNTYSVDLDNGQCLGLVQAHDLRLIEEPEGEAG